MHAEDRQILEIAGASLHDADKISLLNALLDVIRPDSLSLKVFSGLGYWNDAVKSLQGDIDWKLVSTSLAEMSMAATGNITGDVNDQEIIQIIKCDMLDSEKTAQLGALLPHMASDTKSPEIFITLGQWNSEKRIFEGIPDWTSIIEALPSQQPSSDLDWLRTANLTAGSDGLHRSPALRREGKANSTVSKRRRISGTSRAVRSSLPNCGEQNEWLRRLERVALGTD